MLGIGGHAVVGSPAAGGDPYLDLFFYQQIQYPVHGHPVDVGRPVQGVVDIYRKQREIVGSSRAISCIHF